MNDKLFTKRPNLTKNELQEITGGIPPWVFVAVPIFLSELGNIKQGLCDGFRDYQKK